MSNEELNISESDLNYVSDDDLDVDNIDLDDLNIEESLNKISQELAKIDPSYEHQDFGTSSDEEVAEQSEDEDAEEEPDFDELSEEEQAKKIEDMDLRLIERGSKLSQSSIWQFQEDYFNRQGVSAWSGQVPFYITSNCTISFAYAQIIFRYLQDGYRSGFIDENEMFYVIETGTGAGRLSYHILTEITRLFKLHKMENVKFCYIMTDFTQKNIDYWDQNEQLQPFVQQGYLDFALYNLTQSKGIHLENRNLTLNKGKVRNPIFAIANYVFDTIPHDCFRFENGEIHEALVDTATPADNIEGRTVRELEKLIVNFRYNPTNTQYYPDENMNKVLEFYKDNIKESSLLFPTGAMHFLSHLRSFCDDRLIVLSGDKGHTDLIGIDGLPDPHVSFHGSFSLMVNYHAIEKYVEYCGGDSKLLVTNDGFAVNLFSFGKPLSELPETSYAYEDRAHRFSTQEFLHVKNVVIRHQQSVEMTDLISTLKLSYWDPDILISLSHGIIKTMENAPEGLKRDLEAGLPKVFQNFYYIPGGKNAYFELGRIYHGLGNLEKARENYALSLARFEEDWSTHFNIGLCDYYSGDKASAEDHFNQALALDPHSEVVKEWVETMKNERENPAAREETIDVSAETVD